MSALPGWMYEPHATVRNIDNVPLMIFSKVLGKDIHVVVRICDGSPDNPPLADFTCAITDQFGPAVTSNAYHIIRDFYGITLAGG